MQSLIRKLCCSFDPYEIMSFSWNASENKTLKTWNPDPERHVKISYPDVNRGGGGPRCPWPEWVVGGGGGLPSHRRVFKNPPLRILWKLCYLAKSCSNIDVSWVNCTMIIHIKVREVDSPNEKKDRTKTDEFGQTLIILLEIILTELWLKKEHVSWQNNFIALFVSVSCVIPNKKILRRTDNRTKSHTKDKYFKMTDNRTKNVKRHLFVPTS